ncbi:hypothetical protein [Metabacillus halosaccharovorans]|uniref:Uncharacterized protein n=1 Tax=Metabacillus halosaccharovorans TaxID=930124 RepID=A0ABT3DD68_9BACI|nr:hypothetical protein [Metabacillus halosaccharovorans]MCV9884980.1 hypothetical protein [Metabacillus halosaccharovorans]
MDYNPKKISIEEARVSGVNMNFELIAITCNIGYCYICLFPLSKIFETAKKLNKQKSALLKQWECSFS